MINHLSQALIAASFSLAIFFYGGETQAIMLGVMTCLVIGVTTFAFAKINAGGLVWSHLHTGLLLWAALLLVNLATSHLADNSRVFFWLFLSLPIVVLLLSDLRDEYWERLLRYVLPGVLVSAIWGIAEFFTTTGRASGPVLDPNAWASSINLCFFVFASYLFVASKKIWPLVLILLGTLALASFMSYSRVGLVVFFAGLLFIVALSATVKAWRWRGAALLLVCVVGFGLVQSLRDSAVATKNVEGYTLSTEAYGWTVRFAQWQSALAQYQDYPVLGSGLGTFRVLYPQYRTLADQTTAGNYVHNDYIQLLAEMGPLSSVLLLAFIAFLGWHLWRSVRALLFDREAEHRVHIEVAVLIVGVGSVMVHALMNFTLYSVSNQLLLGIALARVVWLKRLGFNLVMPKIRPWLAKMAVSLLMVYVIATHYADAISHDLVYRGGVLPLDRHNPDDQLRVFEILSVIREFRSGSAANRFAMATFYRSSFDAQPLSNEAGRRSLAIATALEYQAGLALNPYSEDIRGFFADFLYENSWLMALEEIDQSPDRLLTEGLALSPLRLRSHVALANHFERSNRSDAAYQLLQQGFPLTGLKYDNYRFWRDEWRNKLQAHAQRRGDHEVLDQLKNSG